MEIRILIVGRGAVAVMLAAQFAHAGFSVVVADRYGTGKTIELCTFSSFDSSLICGKVHFSANDEINIQDFDLIILCTKLFQLRETLAYLNNNGGQTKQKVFIQNGFVEDLVEISENDCLAILNMAIRLINPRTSYSSIFNTIHFPENTSPDVIDVFKRTNFEIKNNENYLYSRLRKFIFACTSAWMAAHNLSIEESFFNKPINNSLYEMIEETVDVLAKYAFSIGENYVATELLKLPCFISDGIDKQHLKETKFLSYTSLFQDLERRNGVTEIECLNGKICSIAKTIGVSSKCNNYLYRSIKFAQKNKLTPLELESKLHKI